MLKNSKLVLKRNFSCNPTNDDIVLLCLIKNEALLLKYFIKHYLQLGVTCFVFIDNGSNDGSDEYLENRRDINCAFYSVRGSFIRNDFGVNWVNQILNDRLKGLWCLVVDADELLVLKDSLTLCDLRSQMEAQGSNVAQACLVDFYPRSLVGAKYVRGAEFTEHSCYFDKFSSDTTSSFITPSGSLKISGGMRKRVYGFEDIDLCLTKKPFFKYDFHATHRLSGGNHWILPINFKRWGTYPWREWLKNNKALKFYDKILIIEHFKFLKPDPYKIFKERVNSWKRTAPEYKYYIKNKKDVFYDEKFSLKFKGIDDLYSSVGLESLEKKYILVITSARHGSTTLCAKIGSQENVDYLGEVFNPEGWISKKVDIDIEPDNVSPCLVLASMFKEKEYLLLKILDIHFRGNLSFKVRIMRKLLTQNKIEKIVFLRRDIKDSYRSFLEDCDTGNWKTTPETKTKGKKKINVGFLVRKHFNLNYKPPGYEQYCLDLENWFNVMKSLVIELRLPMETVNFDEVIKEDFDPGRLISI